ncbi:MAG: FAD-dependent oxidoreductase [Candidatus Thiodiazotropha sp.]
MDDILILGAGLAGYTLAREIRGIDPRVPLSLITADAGDFYSKPMLSTALAGQKSPAELVNATAHSMRERLDMTLLTRQRVQRILADEQRIISDQGEHRYSRLVLALGALPIVPPMRGDAAEDRLVINSLDDYARFRERLPDTPAHVAIIGPGLIGCEFANDLLLDGYRVSLVGPDPYPISTLLPQATAQALQQAMQAAGAEWHLRQTAAIMQRQGSGYRLTLTDASQLDCDLVISAVGLRPDTRLAEAAGLPVNRGIITDRLLQTGDPRIYALGDCAEVDGRNRPYVMPIMHAARALAKTLTGQPTQVVFPPMPVVIKTPLHPVVVLPPEPGVSGDWEEQSEPRGSLCRFTSEKGELKGFALSGERVDEKQSLLKSLS